MLTICNSQKVLVLRLIIKALHILSECFTVCYGFVTLTIRQSRICGCEVGFTTIAKTIAIIAKTIAIIAIILVTQVVTDCNHFIDVSKMVISRNETVTSRNDF